MKIDRYAKAVVGAVVAAGAVLQTATDPAGPGGAGVTADEWVRIVAAGLIGLTVVWAVPNTVASVTATPSCPVPIPEATKPEATKPEAPTPLPPGWGRHHADPEVS